MSDPMHTDAKLYYALLGLDPACSEEEIRAAFRRRAKALHPDTDSGDTTGFIRLKRAYDTLIDPAKRARYDRVSTPSRRIAIPAGPAPLPPRTRPRRSGGVSFARYCAAFLFMGGLSFGAIKAMIDFADVPPDGFAATAPRADPTVRNTEVAKDGSQSGGSGLSRAGFWDASNPTGSHDTRAGREAARPGATASSPE